MSTLFHKIVWMDVRIKKKSANVSKDTQKKKAMESHNRLRLEGIQYIKYD